MLCVGSEAWLREDAIRALAAQCVTRGAAALDAATFTAGEDDPEAIVAAARTLPLASRRRLIVARGPWPATLDCLGWLVRYATAPTPTTCLVVELAESVPLEVRQPLRAAPSGALKEICCQPLKGGALLAWVRQRLQRTTGKVLDPQAAQQLLARVGSELSAVAQALEQVALYVGDRRQVTAQDVAALVGWSVEERVFAVVDAVIRQDRATALRVTRRLLEEEGVAPEELLGALGKHLRRLWAVARQVAMGASHQQAVQQAGVPWHAQEPLRRLAARTSLAVATAALEQLVESDRQLKSGSATPGHLLERCVWELAGPVRPLALNGSLGGELGRRV